MPSPSSVEDFPIRRAIAERRSVARLGGAVGEDEIRELLVAAMMAPNHKMTQPWRFTVLQGTARASLGSTWGALVAAESGFEPEAAATLAAREATKPLRAPVVIVVSTTTSADPVVAEEDFAATAAAVQNLLLTAPALGLAAIWRTGAMVYRPEIKAHLGLEPSDRIVAFVYLGRPEGPTPIPQRRAVDDKIVWLGEAPLGG